MGIHTPLYYSPYNHNHKALLLKHVHIMTQCYPSQTCSDGESTTSRQSTLTGPDNGYDH